MPTKTDERETMQVTVEHAFCRGTGKVRTTTHRIVKSDMARHYEKHVGMYRDGELQAEPCDCRRGPHRETRDCVGCGGRGWNLMTLIVPNPGDKVQVREKQLLEELFGDEVPEGPGTVSRVDGPGEHQLELANGLAVQVSWDRLNKDGSVPKTKEVDLWAFDISEIKVL